MPATGEPLCFHPYSFSSSASPCPFHCKDDITAVESDLALLSADLRATRDIVFANREHVDMGLFNVSAELRNLQNSKVL